MLSWAMLQCWTYYLEQSKENKQNWIGLENFDIYLLPTFYF